MTSPMTHGCHYHLVDLLFYTPFGYLFAVWEYGYGDMAHREVCRPWYQPYIARWVLRSQHPFHVDLGLVYSANRAEVHIFLVSVSAPEVSSLHAGSRKYRDEWAAGGSAEDLVQSPEGLPPSSPPRLWRPQWLRRGDGNGPVPPSCVWRGFPNWRNFLPLLVRLLFSLVAGPENKKTINDDGQYIYPHNPSKFLSICICVYLFMVSLWNPVILKIGMEKKTFIQNY